MSLKVYPNGSQEISVPAGQSIAIRTDGEAKVYYKQGPGNTAPVFYLNSSVVNEEVTLDPPAGVDTVRIDAQADEVLYNVAVSPVIVETLIQGTPTAATVSATLTVAEILVGIVTINEGAAGASAQQLPLATAMDTALPLFGANSSFDFSVINISTVAAEDATVTTNTGWTLVGSMAIQSNDAVTSKSAGQFRARRTAAGAWTLYRVS